MCILPRVCDALCVRSLLLAAATPLSPLPAHAAPLDATTVHGALEFITISTPGAIAKRTVGIEHLTASLRSPQYDVLQNTELLEDRSSLMLLAAVLPPSVVYRRAILIDLGTRDFATGACVCGWLCLRPRLYFWALFRIDVCLSSKVSFF